MAIRQTLFEEYPDIPANEEIIGEIGTNGYAEVPFDLGRTACDELFKDFLSFVELCQQPDGQQFADAVTFKVTDLDNSAYHMTYRQPGAVNPVEAERIPGSDHKFTFHYGTQTIDRALSALGPLPAEMAQCLETSEEFFQEVIRSARIGAAALGLEKVMFAGEPETWIHHMRLLHYIGDTPDLGAAHFDRSVATLAVSESRSGLRGIPGNNGYLIPVTADYIRDLENGLTPIAHHEHVSKFFLGAGYNRLHEKDRKYDLPLLGHDILNDAPNTTRQAVVCFLNPTEAYQGYTVPDSARETGFAEIISHLESLESQEQVA